MPTQTVNRELAHESIKDRLAPALGWQHNASEILNRERIINVQASKQMDMKQKIDLIISADHVPLFYQTGSDILAQFKNRLTGNDFLIDFSEPCVLKKHLQANGRIVWLFDKERSKIGRDDESEYGLYICVSQDGRQIRIVDGASMKRISSILEECLALGKFFLKDDGVTPDIQGGNLIRASFCQITYMEDHDNGNRKILFYVPPMLFHLKQTIPVSSGLCIFDGVPVTEIVMYCGLKEELLS